MAAPADSPLPAAPVAPARTVCALHGIRTHAGWQRQFSEVATHAGWNCDQDRWNYGYFSVLKFLSPGARDTKVKWFRTKYYELMHDRNYSVNADHPPSVVAHSFGTYIVGYALLRYESLRFNKVILCGSILPMAFPWEVIIQRGQVQELRNEYGSRDPWVRCVRWFVPGTGPSGHQGFSIDRTTLPDPSRLTQDRFLFDHSEYFDPTHVHDYWLPFLSRPVIIRPLTTQKVDPPKTQFPWGLLLIYVLIFLSLVYGAYRIYALFKPPRMVYGKDAVPCHTPDYASKVLHKRSDKRDPEEKKDRVMMDKWMEWMDGRTLAREERNDGKQGRLLEQFLVITSTDFEADYKTFRAKVLFRDGIVLDEGVAFLVHSEGDDRVYRPVYRQIKLTGESHKSDPNTLTVVDANKGEHLLLFLRVSSPKLDLPDKPEGYHFELKVNK